jgi:hypothetical protein
MNAATTEQPRPTRATVVTLPPRNATPAPAERPAVPPRHAEPEEEPGYGHGV